MKQTLDVYLHRDLVGKLVQDAHGIMRFQYVSQWLNRSGAIPLSRSLPLTDKRFGRNESRGYFAGILPEQHQREVIAKNLGISAKNDFAMLDRIGGECAGAVTFCPRDNSSQRGRTHTSCFPPKHSRRYCERCRAVRFWRAKKASVSHWRAFRIKLPYTSRGTASQSRSTERRALIF